ncbi:MAG: GDSL-type esterase/lipase family protein [bacterium]|nr:GDSL-type esterase/lipase family protein [bacterium]
MRSLKTAAGVLAVIAVCLLSGELALRAAGALWAPASVLVSHHRIHDEDLGWRLNPDYPDIDAWGFRNQSVPTQVDIVVLGDSQSYGYGVAPELSWPRQLTALSGWSTYTIACSGYSPVHGLAIWDDVVSLQPRIIIAAVYAGNDLYDSFDLVYGHGQLPRLRTKNDQRQAQIAVREASGRLGEQARMVTRMGRQPWPLRDFLRDHSALFHFIHHVTNGSAALAGRLQDSWQSARAYALLHPDYLYPHDGGAGSRTTLTIAKRLLPLDTSDPRIEEGLHVTLGALREMAQRATTAGARLVIVWLPTKELVFAPGLDTPAVPQLNQLIAAETHVQQQVRDTAADLGVTRIDALPALRHSLSLGEGPYPESADGHPTAVGYAQIARVVAAALPARDQL